MLRTPLTQPSLWTVLESICLKWFWVIAFFILCFATYEHSQRSHQRKVLALRSQLAELQSRQHTLQSQQEDLRQEIRSQGDHLWVEQVLMRELGLVPQGAQKVVFIEGEIPS